jgi:protein TonB
MWICSLARFSALLSSKDRPLPPPPIEMSLVETPPLFSDATPARVDVRPPIGHAAAPSPPRPAKSSARNAFERASPLGQPPRAPAASPDAPARSENQHTPEPGTSDLQRTKPAREEPNATDAGAATSANASLGGPRSRPAHALSQPLPQLPDDLRDQAYQVVALARFAVHADGTFEVELAKPTPNPRLNAILLDTLRQWRFAPATEDGHAVESQQQVRVHFDVH